MVVAEAMVDVISAVVAFGVGALFVVGALGAGRGSVRAAWRRRARGVMAAGR